MSVATAAAVAQNPTTNRVNLRFQFVPICRNCPKPVIPFSNFPTSPDPAWRRMLHSSMPLRRKFQFADTYTWRVLAFKSGEAADEGTKREVPGQTSLDEFLSVAEVFCILPLVFFAVVGIACLVLVGLPKQSAFWTWQFVPLVGAVAIGGLIRRRQWQRCCRENVAGFDLIERIEKVEEDLRSSATIVRVLSRQLEKLGIRFRVTRKALKEPISETAALVQKNSEAAQALAMQEDILEKELGEIQKVLLAMQEQQQKQLELILAIGKAGGLLESKRQTASARVIGTSNPIPKKGTKQSEIQTEIHKAANNDIP